MREVFRVLKPGGRLVIIAEIYKGAGTVTSKLAEVYAAASGMKMLTAEEHRQLFTTTGYSAVQLDTLPRKGWICAVGRKAGAAECSV